MQRKRIRDDYSRRQAQSDDQMTKKQKQNEKRKLENKHLFNGHIKHHLKEFFFNQ